LMCRHVRGSIINGRVFRQFFISYSQTTSRELKVLVKALYCCCSSEAFGVPTSHRLRPELILVPLVVQCRHYAQGPSWIAASGTIRCRGNRRDRLAILAIQGPEARAKVAGLMSTTARHLPRWERGPCFGREIEPTGCRRQDGYTTVSRFVLKWSLPASEAVLSASELTCWPLCVTTHHSPPPPHCGLGARDTLAP